MIHLRVEETTEGLKTLAFVAFDMALSAGRSNL
jgi:hypothetical protein